MGAKCPLCGGACADPLFAKAGIPYHACPACSFVFSRPERNANFETAFEDYGPAYGRYLAGSPEDARNFEALIAWVARHRAIRGARVLDVGCGSGKLVRHLRQRSIEAFGLEPAQAIHGRFLAGEPHFFAQTVEEFARARPLGEFEVAFACDVIEHVERPDLFLDALARLLVPGGLLVVSTPDVASWLARLCGRRWHYFNEYHLSYLSRRTLARIAARCGLRETGFARLSRRKSVGYLLAYLADFVLRSRQPKLPSGLAGLSLPVNLFDTMTVCFEKGTAAAE